MWLSPLESSRSSPAYRIRCPASGPLVGIVAHAYVFTRSSLAGTLPEDQCHVSHADPVSGGTRAAQSSTPMGSLFLFEPPAPENVVLSRAPLCAVSSLMNAAATPPWMLTTFPVAPKMSAQSGPLAATPSPKMSAA